MKTHKIGNLFLSLLLSGMALNAQAVTLSGTTVDFTFDDTALGLFTGSGSNGGATVSGNTLTFNPSAFSVDGNSDTLISQTINVTVTPHAGQQLSSLGYAESGLYSELNAKDVAVSGQVRIFDPANANNELTPSIPNPDFSVTGSQLGWQSTIPNQNLAALNVATSLNVTIQNILIAYPNAIISKDFAQLTISTSPVPEVETWTMMLAGICLVGMQIRRRTNSEAHHIG